jgi:hypothetical protein
VTKVTDPVPVPDPDPQPEVELSVQQRTEEVFAKLLDEAEYIIKAGSTQNKITLMKSVIPALMKEMKEDQTSAQETEAKQRLDELFEWHRHQIKGAGDI